MLCILLRSLMYLTVITTIKFIFNFSKKLNFTYFQTLKLIKTTRKKISSYFKNVAEFKNQQHSLNNWNSVNTFLEKYSNKKYIPNDIFFLSLFNFKLLMTHHVFWFFKTNFKCLWKKMIKKTSSTVFNGKTFWNFAMKK